jgi:hypothetical protein
VNQPVEAQPTRPSDFLAIDWRFAILGEEIQPVSNMIQYKSGSNFLFAILLTFHAAQTRIAAMKHSTACGTTRQYTAG